LTVPQASRANCLIFADRRAACRHFSPIAFPIRGARVLFVLKAFLPNTGENDDRAVVNRCRARARAASRRFEHNKITHWLFSPDNDCARPRIEQDSSPAAKPTVRSLNKVSQDDEK
jgi:hypothetical protein